jgi:hypothetical protein
MKFYILFILVIVVITQVFVFINLTFWNIFNKQSHSNSQEPLTSMPIFLKVAQNLTIKRLISYKSRNFGVEVKETPKEIFEFLKVHLVVIIFLQFFIELSKVSLISLFITRIAIIYFFDSWFELFRYQNISIKSTRSILIESSTILKIFLFLESKQHDSFSICFICITFIFNLEKLFVEFCISSLEVIKLHLNFSKGFSPNWMFKVIRF